MFSRLPFALKSVVVGAVMVAGWSLIRWLFT